MNFEVDVMRQLISSLFLNRRSGHSHTKLPQQHSRLEKVMECLPVIVKNFNTLLSSSMSVKKIGDQMFSRSQRLREMAHGLELALSDRQTHSGIIEEFLRDIDAILNDVASRVELIEKQRAALSHLKSNIDTLSDLAQQIGKSTEEVRAITFDLRILSFNASVEASRAGESGRGFAIIAERVNQLAGESQEIADIIAKRTLLSLEGNNSLASTLLVTTNDLSDSLSGAASAVSKARASLKTREKRATEDISALLSDELMSFKNLTKQMIGEVEGGSHDASNAKQLGENLQADVERLNGEIATLGMAATGTNIATLKPEALEDFRYRHSDILLVDVRGSNEFNDDLGHITGAQLITLDEQFESALASLNKDQTTVFICRSGGRSLRAARLAQSMGFRKVINLDGGMLAWNKSLQTISSSPQK
jgi:rhodanese-related sulfurtransferase